MKEYCTQNNGDCATCSLVNYGRDCQNIPLWGGKREGAGRPEMDDKKKPRSIKFSDAEWEEVREKAEAKGISISAYVRETALNK